MRFEAELLEFCGQPVGIVLVVGRADVVRAGGKAAHVFAHVVGARNGAKFFFPLALGAGGFGGVAVERGFIGRGAGIKCESADNDEAGEEQSEAH